jgi:hypothetical protein
LAVRPTVSANLKILALLKPLAPNLCPTYSSPTLPTTNCRQMRRSERELGAASRGRTPKKVRALCDGFGSDFKLVAMAAIARVVAAA